MSVTYNILIVIFTLNICCFYYNLYVIKNIPLFFHLKKLLAAIFNLVWFKMAKLNQLAHI